MPFNNIPIKNPGRYFEQFVKVLEPCKGGGGGQQMALSPAISRRDDYRLGPSTSWGEDRHQSERWRKAAKNWNDIFIEFPKMLTHFYWVSKSVDTFLLSFQKCWHVFIELQKMLTRFYWVSKSVDTFLSSCQKCWHVFIEFLKMLTCFYWFPKMLTRFSCVAKNVELVMVLITAVFWWKDWIFWSNLSIYQIVCIKQ